MKLCGFNEFCKDHGIETEMKDAFKKYLNEYQGFSNLGDGYHIVDSQWLKYYSKFLEGDTVRGY